MAVKTLGVFVGGGLFLLGILTVVVALTEGTGLEVGRDNTVTYTPREQVYIGLAVAAVGGLLAGIPIFLSVREVVRVGRRRLRDKGDGSA